MAVAKERHRTPSALALIRFSRGLTQRELAERSGIDRVTIARLETNVTTPTMPTLIALATALDWPLPALAQGFDRRADDTTHGKATHAH